MFNLLKWLYVKWYFIWLHYKQVKVICHVTKFKGFISYLRTISLALTVPGLSLNKGISLEVNIYFRFSFASLIRFQKEQKY